VIYKALECIHSGLVKGNVVVAVADGGEKYLHTVFSERWLNERNLLDPTIWSQLDSWLGERDERNVHPSPDTPRLHAVQAA
jgi:cystathionine beta-synthase